MPFSSFLFQAVLISLSGVMSPGPLTAVTIGKGTDSPHSGALIAIGHGIVEFPLMALIYFGLGSLLKNDNVKMLTFLLGGLFLLIMGIGMLKNINNIEITSSSYAKSSILSGLLLSSGNPYFLVWWATVGSALISQSIEFGILGFLIFTILHWLCDFIWLYFLSALSFNGGKFFGKIFQKVAFGFCGILLLFFSCKFIYEGANLFRIL